MTVERLEEAIVLSNCISDLERYISYAEEILSGKAGIFSRNKETGEDEPFEFFIKGIPLASVIEERKKNLEGLKAEFEAM